MALHVFRDCVFAQQVWSLAPLRADLGSHEGPLLDFLSTAKQTTCLPPSGISEAHLFSWICWYLWLARNSEIFSDKKYTPSEVLHKAILETKAWQVAQDQIHKPQPSDKNHFHVPKNLIGFSYYTDGAWDAQTLNCGYGWHMTSNSDPAITASSADTKKLIPSSLMAEANAVLEALLAATEHEHYELQVFSDNMTLIQLFRSGDSHKEIHFILCDIRALLPSFNSFSIGFIPHKENVLADSLAKEAMRALNSP